MSTRAPRGRRSGAAVVVAVIAVVLCAAVVFESVHLAVDGDTWGYHSRDLANALQGVELGDVVVLVVGIVLLALGLLVLLAGVLPARRPLVELADPDPAVASGLRERSLRRTVEAAATGVDGVTDADVRVARRSVTVRATTSLRRVEGLDDRIRDAVTARLDGLDLRRPRNVRVRLRQKEA